MISVPCDGYTFSFEDAIDAFKFDEKDSQNPHFHGVPMKAVDVVAEFDNEYVFIEIKEHHDLGSFEELADNNDENAAFKALKQYLIYKYRDSFLFRYAEDKVDKPVHYICLLNFDSTLCSKIKKSLSIELPVRKPSPRWNQVIASSCQVRNIKKTSSITYPQNIVISKIQ